MQYPDISHNKFVDILGAGLIVIDTSARIDHNDLEDTGGRDLVTSTPYGIFFSPACPEDASRRNHFNANELDTMQTAVALIGRMAAFWLNFNGEDEGYMDVEENKASGMEIGIRFEDMVDTSPSDDLKLQLRRFALTEGNLFAKGTWHDLVRGAPGDDIDIDTDPNDSANFGRFCDDGCPNSRLIFAILLVVAFGLLILCCLCLCCFLLTRRTTSAMTYSNYLEEEVPTSVMARSGWTANNHRTSSTFYRSVPPQTYENEYQQDKVAYGAAGRTAVPFNVSSDIQR